MAAGCASGPPVLDTSAEAERSFDGLYPLRNSRADAAWAVENLDLSGYNKVLLQGAGIEYTPAKSGSRSRVEEPAAVVRAHQILSEGRGIAIVGHVDRKLDFGREALANVYTDPVLGHVGLAPDHSVGAWGGDIQPDRRDVVT